MINSMSKIMLNHEYTKNLEEKDKIKDRIEAKRGIPIRYSGLEMPLSYDIL
jgi:hypothetical protein